MMFEMHIFAVLGSGCHCSLDRYIILSFGGDFIFQHLVDTLTNNNQ